MGRHVTRLARFAIQYPGWHTYGKDPATVRAIRALVRHGILEVNPHRQFRAALPQWAYDGIDAARKAQ